MKPPRAPLPYPIIGPRWRPTWEEYAEVVTGMSQTELESGLARIIRRHDGPRDVDPDTLRALARAGMVGTSPDFRKTLRPSFGRANAAMLAESLRSIEIALPRYVPDQDIWAILLGRALTASRRLGHLPARRATDNPTPGATRAPATSRGSRSPAPPLRRKSHRARR